MGPCTLVPGGPKAAGVPMVLGALFLGTMPTPGHGERPQGQDRASLEHPLPGASPLAQAAQTAAGWEAANLPFNIYMCFPPPAWTQARCVRALRMLRSSASSRCCP